MPSILRNFAILFSVLYRQYLNLYVILHILYYMLAGFDENAADVRIAQYESSKRTPKEKMVSNISEALDVCPQALQLPDIDTYVGLARTLFALEDLYGLKISSIDDELCLTLDKSKGMTYVSMYDIFRA